MRASYCLNVFQRSLFDIIDRNRYIHKNHINGSRLSVPIITVNHYHFFCIKYLRIYRNIPGRDDLTTKKGFTLAARSKTFSAFGGLFPVFG